MGFSTGRVSFRRYAVTGQHPKEVGQGILEKLGEYALEVGEFSVPDEVEYGWCGGRHVLDGKFSFEHNVYAEALHFAMRMDTNRVPGELRKAYQMMEEEAGASVNPSGYISKKQKRDVKEVVREKVEEDLKSGKFRRSKLVPILWDFGSRTVYCAGSNTAMEKVSELFERTFSLELESLSAGAAASRWLADQHKRRDYEDLRPTRFVHGPEGEKQWPEYPWVAKGPGPKDFLGNEFLLWLWHETEAHGGVIKGSGCGEVGVVMERLMDLECVYGVSGKDGLRGDGPTGMPEAREGLRSGKVPRRCGMILETGGRQFELTFNGESLGCSSAKLPEVEEAEDARVVFEERIGMLRDLAKGIDGLYETFLGVRASSGWEGRASAIRRWIGQLGKVGAAS